MSTFRNLFFNDDEGADSSRKKSRQVRYSALFQNQPHNMIAFAPSSSAIMKDIQDMANLPSPTRTAGKADHNAERWRHHHASDHSDETVTKKPKAFNLMGKVPLPRPYKKQRANLELRRAERSFIYGRDEENDYTERDSRVKTPCCGVICFHALEFIDLVVNKKSFIESVPISYFCLLSIGSIKRCTKIVHAWDPHLLKMDYFVHLSVDVSEWREAPNNKLRIELWSFQDPEAHFIVGTVEIHIYNFIKLQHTIDTVSLWSDGIKVGMLAYEVAFSYGAFGYGHSNQLTNFSQPIMETISHSMFPRIKLDDTTEVSDKAFQARLPTELKMFTYHSLILEVDQHPSAFFGASKKSKPKRVNRIDLEPKPMVVQQVEFEQGFPVHCKLHMNIWQKVIQPDFNDMYGEFVCIGHKRGRLDYLQNLVQGRMRDLYQEETAPLFQHIPFKDLDNINTAEYNPAEIIHPKSIPCPFSQPYKIGPEDEQFQDKFPAARRETGYLSKIFGFKQEDTVDVDPSPEGRKMSDDMSYLQAHSVRPPPKDAKKCNILIFEWLSRQLLNMKRSFQKILLFIFPEVHDPLEVPEISVTVATPEGSTTNIYSYFSREPKDGNTNANLARIVRQTTQLIDQARKSHVHRKALSDSDSSDEEDETLIEKERKAQAQAQ